MPDETILQRGKKDNTNKRWEKKRVSDNTFRCVGCTRASPVGDEDNVCSGDVVASKVIPAKDSG